MEGGGGQGLKKGINTLLLPMGSARKGGRAILALNLIQTMVSAQILIVTQSVKYHYIIDWNNFKKEFPTVTVCFGKR